MNKKQKQTVCVCGCVLCVFHRLGLACKEGKGKLFRPGWLAWAAETMRLGVSCPGFGCQLVPNFPFLSNISSES